MRRRAAQWPRRPVFARGAVLRAALASLAAALVTLVGVTSATGLGSSPGTASDSAAAKAPASAALATVAGGGSVSLAGSAGHVRGGVPTGAVLLTSAGADDTDDRALAPPEADVFHRVRPVGPVVQGPETVARAPRPASGVTSTARGRAPPA